MSASSKITQSGAFGNEFSGAGNLAHQGWGTTPPIKPVNSVAGFPYLTFEHDPESVMDSDTSVNSRAFQTGEREVGRTLDKGLSFNNRCDGIDKELAWMFGWEGKTLPVIIFQVAAFTDATTGMVFTEESHNFTFIRQYKSKLITGVEVFWAVFTGINVPTNQSGTLTAPAGSTDLVFSSFDSMYQHTYELSNDGRMFRPFTGAEITALGNQGTPDDKRTCMASLAKKFPSYNMVFNNTKCYKFGFKWSPQKFTEISANWLGFDQKRIKTSDSTYADTDFNMLCSMIETNNIYAHNQTRLEIGVSTNQYNGHNYTFYPATDLNVDVELPLQKQQDTESGLFLVDPVLNGLIKITAGVTITHSVDETFMDWRDQRTNLSARISSVFGAYSQELLIKKFTLPKAGPDNGDVSAEPLTLSVALTCGTHSFDTWLKNDLGVNPEIMGSPLVLRVVNKNPYNEMTGRDSTGTRRP